MSFHHYLTPTAEDETQSIIQRVLDEVQKLRGELRLILGHVGDQQTIVWSLLPALILDITYIFIYIYNPLFSLLSPDWMLTFVCRLLKQRSTPSSRTCSVCCRESHSCSLPVPPPQCSRSCLLWYPTHSSSSSPSLLFLLLLYPGFCFLFFFVFLLYYSCFIFCFVLFFFFWYLICKWIPCVPTFIWWRSHIQAPQANNICSEWRFWSPSITCHKTALWWWYKSPLSLLPFHFLRLIRIKGYYKRFQYLPSTITHITFGKSFNHTINRILPPSLTHLTFGEQYNSCVRYLPDNITHLTFGYWFNLPVDHLPQSITHLTFGENFSQPLTHLPHALQVLKLRQSFHHQLESMPNSIHTLTTYTRASINSLPSSLTRLEHHSTINNLNCTLPSSLTHLHLSGGGPSLDLSNLPLKHLEIGGTDDFNPNLNTLPTTLQRLDLRRAWNGPLDSLPSSLTQLNIASFRFNHPLDHLPPSLTCLSLQECNNLFAYPLHNLPPAITKLEILCEYDTPLQLNKNPLLTHLQLGFGNLPSSLRDLSFRGSFDQSVDELPSNITHLTFGDFFNKNVDSLPSSITHLIFGSEFNQPVDLLPPNITHITFGYCFDHTVQQLPQRLTHLSFGFSFNQPVQHLPPKLTHLSCGFSFNQDINTLPSSITHLKLGIKYASKIHTLPSSLHSFYFTTFADPDSIHLLAATITLSPSVKDVRLTLVCRQGDRSLNYEELAQESVDVPLSEYNKEDGYALEVRMNFVSKRLVVDWLSTKAFVKYEINNYNKFEC